MTPTTNSAQYQDTRTDAKLVLSAALDGKVAAMGIAIDQVFLVFTTAYVLIPTLMVVLSLVLRPRVNRIANIVVALVYAVSIVAFSVGETWASYLLGSAVEVVLLVAIVRTAWTWPRSRVAPSGMVEA